MIRIPLIRWTMANSLSKVCLNPRQVKLQRLKTSFKLYPKLKKTFRTMISLRIIWLSTYMILQSLPLSIKRWRITWLLWYNSVSKKFRTLLSQLRHGKNSWTLSNQWSLNELILIALYQIVEPFYWSKVFFTQYSFKLSI